MAVNGLLDRVKVVMAEPSATIEEAILQICERTPAGLTDREIVATLKQDVKPAERIAAYNSLLGKGRLRLAERRSTETPQKKVVLYQWVSARDAERFRGLDASDRMVYFLIEKSRHSGLTKRDVKFKTNIQSSSELKQILDRLIDRNLIKEIKSVQGANKRVYIISELEPSVAHTGGPWYNDNQEFDQEFIDALYNQVLAFIGSMEYVTVEQVTNYVAEIKLSMEELSAVDIRTLMTTMLYDGQIELCEGGGADGAVSEGVEYYRRILVTPAVNHLASLPCGPCPVFRDCRPGGVISPTTCVYMDSWLKQVADW